MVFWSDGNMTRWVVIELEGLKYIFKAEPTGLADAFENGTARKRVRKTPRMWLGQPVECWEHSLWWGAFEKEQILVGGVMSLSSRRVLNLSVSRVPVPMQANAVLPQLTHHAQCDLFSRCSRNLSSSILCFYKTLLTLQGILGSYIQEHTAFCHHTGTHSLFLHSVFRHIEPPSQEQNQLFFLDFAPWLAFLFCWQGIIWGDLNF